MKSFKVEKIEVFVFDYSRKSQDDKEDTDTSIKNQQELNQTICKGKGWTLLESFIDKNVSGSDRDRPGLIKCIKRAKEYKVLHPQCEVYILVKDQDRFARDYAFMGDTLKDFDAFGVKIYSIMKNDFLDSNDLGDTIMSVMNEQMIKEGRKKASILVEQKINKNLPCIPAPFGYKYGKNKSWIIDSKKSKIVERIIKMYLNYEDMKDIIRTNEDGSIISKMSYITNTLKINKSLYYRVLNNARKGLYNGYVVFDRKHKGSGSKVVRIEEIKYKSNFPSLITEETYNEVNNR